MLPAVQLFGRGQHAAGQFGRAARGSLEAEVVAARMKGQLERWVEVIVAVGTGGVLWYGASAVVEGRLTPGDLVVFAAYLRSMYRPTRRIATNWLQMSRATVGASGAGSAARGTADGSETLRGSVGVLDVSGRGLSRAAHRLMRVASPGFHRPRGCGRLGEAGPTAARPRPSR